MEEITEIVLPLLNVNRRTRARIVNPHEPHQQIINATSAGTKQSYAYEVLIETLEEAVINPNNAFVFGCDYRIPVMHGLLDKKYIQEEIKRHPHSRTAFLNKLGLSTLIQLSPFKE